MVEFAAENVPKRLLRQKWFKYLEDKVVIYVRLFVRQFFASEKI